MAASTLIAVKLLQSENALLPIVVTEAGRVMLVIPQPEKAAPPMVVRELFAAKVIVLTFQQF